MEQIRRTSLVEKVQTSILRLVLSDRFDEGDRLPGEIQLGKIIGVGRSTIREALRSLQTMGYVEQRAGSGTYLVSKNPGTSLAQIWFKEHSYELLDILQVRMMIEPKTAFYAAHNATQEEIDTLLGMHTVFASAVNAADVGAISEYDEAFHHQIALMSHNPLLLDINQPLTKASKEFRERTYSLHGAASVLRSHSAILNALVDRDAEKAEGAMVAHLEENIQLARKFTKE